MDTEQLKALVAAATDERDRFTDEFNRSAFIIQANQQLAYLNGKIDTLNELLLAAAADETAAPVEGEG